MVNNNNIYDLPKTYTVAYFDVEEWDKGLTPEEILKREQLAELIYQDNSLHGPQYGPSERKKKKKWEVSGKFDEHWIDTLNDRVAGENADFWDVNESADKNGDWHAMHFGTSARASAGVGGVIASGGASASAFRFNDGLGDIKIGSASIGGEAGIGAGVTAKYSAGIDAVNLHTNNGFRANVGIDVGSGGSIGPTGVEVKVLGFGVDVGKKIGISTPLGGISIDLEEACIIQ